MLEKLLDFIKWLFDKKGISFTLSFILFLLSSTGNWLLYRLYSITLEEKKELKREYNEKLYNKDSNCNSEIKDLRVKIEVITKENKRKDSMALEELKARIMELSNLKNNVKKR